MEATSQVCVLAELLSVPHFRLRALAGERRRFGYRRLYVLLRRETADATEPACNGYLLTVACPCGVVFERWVTPEDAELDYFAPRD